MPLELTDAKFTIPKKAGWPRLFLADVDSNRDRGRGRQGQPLGAGLRYATVRTSCGRRRISRSCPRRIPALKTDKDGWAEPVAPDSTALAVAPAI